MATQENTTTAKNAPYQMDLFGDRMPYKPYCGDDFLYGLKIRTRRSALSFPYIQANPPRLTSFLIFDVDRPGAAFAYEDANLPAPAWACVSERAHAHLAWALDAPVLTGDASREAPLRYLVAVENAFHHKLQADPSYSGLMTKNPWHGKWRTHWADPKFHTLGGLAEWVDLKKFIPKGKPEKIGLGRNVVVFDDLRIWAYRAVRKHRNVNGWAIQDWNDWLSDCYRQGLELNGFLPRPIENSRVIWHIAKSVAKFCWNNDPKMHRKFIDRQSWKGKRSGEVRWKKAELMMVEAIRLRYDHGLTHNEISVELGIPRGTITRWLLEKRVNQKLFTNLNQVSARRGVVSSPPLFIKE